MEDLLVTLGFMHTPWAETDFKGIFDRSSRSFPFFQGRWKRRRVLAEVESIHFFFNISSHNNGCFPVVGANGCWKRICTVALLNWLPDMDVVPRCSLSKAFVHSLHVSTPRYVLYTFSRNLIVETKLAVIGIDIISSAELSDSYPR